MNTSEAPGPPKQPVDRRSVLILLSCVTLGLVVQAAMLSGPPETKQLLYQSECALTALFVLEVLLRLPSSDLPCQQHNRSVIGREPLVQFSCAGCWYWADRRSTLTLLTSFLF